MIRAILHLLNDQPLAVDLLETPTPGDIAVICTNVRTLDGKRPARVDTRDAASCDGRGDDAAISEVWSLKLPGVLPHAGDLEPSVDTRGRGADVGFHDAYRIFLLDWICGVPFAACASVRIMARRARLILKALCA